MNLLKILSGFLLLLISLYGIGFYAAGSHGHLMFRPHMLEDWIIWGIVVISGSLGIYILMRMIKNK